MANKDMYFRADVVRSGDVRVNRKEEVIEGFAVVTKGVTHDERGEFDDIALDSIVEFGNKAKAGIKSRFGHPNMSSTALGTFLGRAKNFRRDGDIVRADLHIDKTAHETPDGDLAGYVMNLAESDPQAFGSSMVIHWDEEFRAEKTKDGEDLPPFIRVKKLLSVDIVDDPAANNGLFGMPFFSESVRPSAEMTAFLDRFLNQPEAVERVIVFLDRYGRNKKEEKQMSEELTLEKFKAEHAGLYNSVHALGVEEGIKKERERAVAILKKSKAFKDMGDLALETVESGATFENAVIKFQDKQLEGLQKASVPPLGPDAEDSPGKKQTTHLERAKKYQQEHGGSMTDALKATAQKHKEA
ncbi:MAG: hypothetical protein BWY42_01688 [Candidatus Omnitrophica bacterium ADurb.Bin277]|nr:MAG: hypothetical protein BWY42_01688 [Candidatus Omnitrophica bacterium ADurb.Bin277]